LENCQKLLQQWPGKNCAGNDGSNGEVCKNEPVAILGCGFEVGEWGKGFGFG